MRIVHHASSGGVIALLLAVLGAAALLAGCGSFDAPGAARAAAAFRSADEAIRALAHASDAARRARAVREVLEPHGRDDWANDASDRVDAALDAHAHMLATLAQGYEAMRESTPQASWPAQVGQAMDALVAARTQWRAGQHDEAMVTAASVARAGVAASVRARARRSLDGLAHGALRLSHAMTPELETLEAIIVSEQRATLRVAIEHGLLDVEWPPDALGVGLEVTVRNASSAGEAGVQRRAQEAAWGAWCEAQSRLRLAQWRWALHEVRGALDEDESEGDVP